MPRFSSSTTTRGIRDALHLVLDEEYEVIGAADGVQALATLAAQKVDLILLDLVMSPADGFEVLEQRGRQQQDVPIIVLSALNNAWTAAAAMRLGAVDYVTKPFDEEALLELIRETLASPAGPRGRPHARSLQPPAILLVGLDLGAYVSLTVLLRPQCRVMRMGTVIEALTVPFSTSTNVLVVDRSALGSHGFDAIPWLRARLPHAEIVVIDAAGGASSITSVPCPVLAAPARVTDLLVAIGSHVATNGSAGHRYRSRVGSVLDYLADHYADVSVRRLGRVVGASPGHLSALFREATGLALKAYMTELRIEAAKWLLLEAGEKVETVAARIGLHDASHLSKLFVRYAGTRPGAYRRPVSSGWLSGPSPRMPTEGE